MTIDIELLLARHLFLFLGWKGCIECLNCGGVPTAIGGGRRDIYPFFAFKRIRHKLTNEKCRWKKIVDYLYIDANADHIALQFREKKGDLTLNEKQQKNNNAIAKLVYIYEGIENEAPQSKRHRLVNPYYFSRSCEGELH